jgi:hypothetical protein
MKAILIQSETQMIELIDIDTNNKLNEYYKWLNCDTVQAINLRFKDRTRQHSLYYDDESRLNDTHQTGFEIEGYQIIGHGVIVGFNPTEGDDITVCSLQ